MRRAGRVVPALLLLVSSHTTPTALETAQEPRPVKPSPTSRPTPIVALRPVEDRSEPAVRRAIARASRSAGYDRLQHRCLVNLWWRESRLRPDARNRRPVNGLHAGGIPQILGLDPKLPTSRQISRGLSYIESRYKTPCRALRFHDRHGWY